MTNLFKTTHTKFYQTGQAFVEDMTKTFWCVFSVDSVKRFTHRFIVLYIIACSHHQHEHNKTALSCPCRRCKHNWWQDKTVLSCLDPVSNLQLFSLKSIQDYWKLGNWKLGPEETKLIESGSRQDKTVLSCLQLCSHRRCGQDKTVLSCLCRWCEEVIKDTET